MAVVKPALRHRIAPNYAAHANKIDSEKLIDMLVEHVREKFPHLMKTRPQQVRRLHAAFRPLPPRDRRVPT